MTFTLSCLSKDNFNVRDPNGQIIYWVQSPLNHLMSAHPVLFYKLGPSGEKTKYAEVKFHRWSSSVLTRDGKRTYLDDTFMPRGWLNKCVAVLFWGLLLMIPSFQRILIINSSPLFRYRAVKTPHGVWRWTDESRIPQVHYNSALDC